MSATTTNTATPNGAASDARLPESVIVILDQMDFEHALDSLEEMFLIYVRTLAQEPVPPELHDSICTLYMDMRDIFRAKKLHS